MNAELVVDVNGTIKLTICSESPNESALLELFRLQLKKGGTVMTPILLDKNPKELTRHLRFEQETPD